MEKILKENGFKITPSRLMILSLMIKANKPVSVENIYKELQEKTDITTIYRFLNKLADKNIVYKTTLGDNKAYFELQKNHHHHIICKECGIREKVDVCVNEKANKIIKKSKKFSTLENHILEFFGKCNNCS